MIRFEVYLGSIIQLKPEMLVLLLEIIQFAITSRQAVSTVKVVDTKRLVAKRIGSFDYVPRMRCPLQKTEIGFTKPFVEIIEHPLLRI